MFVIAWTAPVRAQLPSGCSSADQKHAAVYADAAVRALLNKENGKVAALNTELESGLSKACLAALDREQPVRVRCSKDERNKVLKHYQSMMASLLHEDYQGYFRSARNLEASVSSGCWLALNQTQDPRFRQACSASDLDVMASYAGRQLRVAERALQRTKPGEVPDASELEPLLKKEYAQISPECQNAWDRVMEENTKAIEAELAKKAAGAELPQEPARPRPGYGNGLQMPPRVYDHGGGTFSAPGIGACGPSGCVLFR
jgi:hypothetical protein